MEILLKTANTVLLEIDGKPELLPNNDYTTLRFIRFGGKRIKHDFGDGCIIQETYNRGIYNCECDGELIQVYDGGQLARAILDDDRETYRQVFGEWFGEKMEAAVIDASIGGFGDRVRRVEINGKDAYVIDGVWGVGAGGGAMYSDGNSWQPLCLVADRTEDREIVLPCSNKPIRVNARTWVVLAKIMFLLFPRPESVFMGQLPDHLKNAVLAAQAFPGGR